MNKLLWAKLGGQLPSKTTSTHHLSVVDGVTDPRDLAHSTGNQGQECCWGVADMLQIHTIDYSVHFFICPYSYFTIAQKDFKILFLLFFFLILVLWKKLAMVSASNLNQSSWTTDVCFKQNNTFHIIKSCHFPKGTIECKTGTYLYYCKLLTFSLCTQTSKFKSRI